MRTINGVQVYGKPGSCGTCPFFFSGSSALAPTNKGMCCLFDEQHHSYINIPARCSKLFNKALKYPEGTNLIITL